MNQKESSRLSDYQRIVSYLYEYHHGIKGSNVGFAKIEKRQDQLRVFFHVKTNDQTLEYKIYFYRFHEGVMEGIFLDTIKQNNSMIECKHTYPLISEFETMDGFLVYHSNEHFFGSQWNEHPIIIRNFVPLEKKENNNETNKGNETTEEKDVDVNSNLSEYIEALQLEKDAKKSVHPDPVKGFDWKEFPTLPMPASYSLNPSIKIELKDLDQIPDLDEHVKTNGFLLLNYGNFGHLMLAKDQDSGQRYLGIPGIFDNEKAFISRLFGFKTFITVPLKPHKTGNFGYFLLPV